MRILSVVWLGSTIALFVVTACHPSSSAGSQQLAIDATAPPSASLDASAESQASNSDDAEFVHYVEDGTLLATNAHALLARARDGTVRRRRLESGEYARLPTESDGALTVDGDVVTLLATPSLDVLYRGVGTFAASDSAILVDDELLVSHRGVLVRLPFSHLLLGQHGNIQTVFPVASETRINVTYEDGAAHTSSILYDAENRAALGLGISLGANGLGISGGTGIPKGAIANDVGFAIRGDDMVVRISLATGKVVRQTHVRCGEHEELGNPTPNANGDLLLVTCGPNGVVLDGLTLFERRRIPRVHPACDDTGVLGGLILPDGHTLRVGCGDEARLDLTTGKYRCADPMDSVGDHSFLTPNVPRCHSEAGSGDSSATSLFGHSGRYYLHGNAVMHDAKVLVRLEEGSQLKDVAPDESEFAYVRNGNIVADELPHGTLRGEYSMHP